MPSKTLAKIGSAIKSNLTSQNVAAALDMIRGHASDIDRAHSTVANHVEQQEETIEQLSRELASEKTAHATEVGALKQAMAAAAEKADATILELRQKLSKVQSLLA